MLPNESRNAKRLHQGRQFSYEKISAYRQPFINEATGLFHPHYLQERDCPVCGSDRYREVFRKGGGITVKCSDCSMIYLNPAFSEESLALYYKHLNTGQADIITNEGAFYREIYTMGLELIEKYIQPASLLDIGCSSGFFLDLAKEKGWHTTGIEPGLAEADVAKKKGHALYSGPVERLPAGKRFDAITLWDVFEHILEGKKMLLSLSDRLTQQGIIFLQIPNSSSLAARILQEKCHMHDGLEHVNLYNPKTIGMLVESCGFTVVQMNSVISELAVITTYLNYESPYFGEAGTPPVAMFNEEAIHAELMGYKLQVAIKRQPGMVVSPEMVVSTEPS